MAGLLEGRGPRLRGSAACRPGGGRGVRNDRQITVAVTGHVEEIGREGVPPERPHDKIVYNAGLWHGTAHTAKNSSKSSKFRPIVLASPLCPT